MTTPEITALIGGIVAAAIVFLVLYVAWQQLVAEFLRQRLFEIRDSVFNLAAEEKIDFNSDAYRQFRNDLNTIIRYAHRITIPRILVLSLFTNSRTDTNEYFLSGSFKGTEVYKTMKMKEREIWRAVISSACIRSPILLLATPILFPAFILGVSLNTSNRIKAASSMARITRKINDDARFAC